MSCTKSLSGVFEHTALFTWDSSKTCFRPSQLTDVREDVVREGQNILSNLMDEVGSIVRGSKSKRRRCIRKGVEDDDDTVKRPLVGIQSGIWKGCILERSEMYDKAGKWQD